MRVRFDGPRPPAYPVRRMPSHATTKEIAARSPLSGRPVGLLLAVRAQPPRPSPPPPRPLGRRDFCTRAARRRTRTQENQRERCALSRDPEEVPRMSSTTDTVRIFDTTLRDGEQSPGIALNAGEKVEIARQLERLGVDIIEAGFAISSPGEVEGIRAVARARSTASSRRWPAPTTRTSTPPSSRCRTRSNPRIHTFIATSDIHMEHKLRMTREQVLESAARAVRRAKCVLLRRRVLVRGRDPHRPGVHGRGRARGDRRRRDHHQHPRHRRLHGARGVRRDPARAARARARAGRRRAVGALPRRPGPGGRQLAGRRRRPARARSSARSTASASGRATRRSRRS